MDGMDIDDPPPLPDNVLVEVRRFILGCAATPVESSGVASLYSTEQSKLALHLLKTLPCARSAVLEYLCNVFNEAVKCHLGPKMLSRGSQPPQSPGYVDALNTIVSQAQEVLLDFVGNNPESWAPIVSAWAIELLGQISSEYSQHCARSNASLQDMFQMYTACPASSALLEITSRCVSTLIASCPDLCVNELLNTAVRHAPAFDWVVAHIGSCFPKTIIARVLCVGLKDFCVFHVSGGANEVGADVSPATKMFSAKMNSVVGILNYLTSRGHKLDIRCAIHSQFQESLSPLEDDAVLDAPSSSSSSIDSATLQYATLPYLLHLASLSPVLLKIVAADIVASFSKPAVLRQLTEHLERWMKATSSNVSTNPGSSSVEDPLLSLTVSLIIRIDDSNGALDVLKLLMHTADPESFAVKGNDDEGDDDDDDDIPYIPDVAKRAAYTILDHLMLLLQHRVYISFKDRADVPFLIAVKDHWRPICEMLTPSTSSSSAGGQLRHRRRRLCSRLETTVVRLLTFVSLQSESLSSAVLSTIVLDSSSARDASLFFPILTGVQSLTPPVLVNVLHAVFEAVSARQEEFAAFRALTNVRHLLEIEKHYAANSSPSEGSGLMPNASLKACLQKPECLTTLAKILSSFSSCRVLRVGIQLLLHLGLANSSMSSSALLATGVAVSFFKLVAESCSTPNSSYGNADEAVKKRLEYQKTLTLSSQFLAKICQRSHSIRTVVLRALLEGCLSPGYSNLFSTTCDSQTVLTISDSSQIGGHSLNVSSDSVAPSASLRDDNYALPSQRSGRTLPSGVIGDGLRQNKNGGGLDRNQGRGLSTDSAFTGISDASRKANRALLLDVFYRCCSNQDIEDLSESTSSSESASTAAATAKSAASKKLPRLNPSKSATQNLSHLLVELVSPEVLHGGSAWPDEDTVRQTVERDLVIKKRLQNHDVILDVIDLVAKGGATSLVPCLPIIRAWMASLIIFWDSNRDSNPGAASNTWYYGASLRLVKAMALGNLIPHPLSHSDELFQYAAPFERYLLLVNIWRFMKEVPLPLDLDEDKLESRLSDVDSKFIEVMRSVINANIARASPLFGFLFPAPKKKTPTVSA